MGVNPEETCKKGHPFDERNTRILKNGWRQCRECDRLKAKERRDLLRGDKPNFKKDPSTLRDKCKRDHPLVGDNIKWVDTPWGKQKQCRECTKVRNVNYRERFQRIAAGIEEPSPRGARQKEYCKNGHPMEGENVYYRPDGTGRTCKACALGRVKDHQARTHAAYLEYKAELRRQKKTAESEALKLVVIRLRSQYDKFPELLAALKNYLAPQA